jgi:phosphoribosyl-ATP pyrophosphohydrolase
MQKPMASFTVHDLEQRVRERAQQTGTEASYTRRLLDGGVERCARKFGEEAIETVLAAVSEDRERLIAEAADLIYHLLVVLAARGIALADVEAVLAARTQQSGLAEKASRGRKSQVESDRLTSDQVPPGAPRVGE